MNTEKVFCNDCKHELLKVIIECCKCIIKNIYKNDLYLIDLMGEIEGVVENATGLKIEELMEK